MSGRNSEDPLLREFLDTYQLNLLAVPRENAQVGDTYVDTPKGVAMPGQLRFLLTPQLVMPKISTGEKMTHIAGKQTAALDLKVGLSLLGGFFAAIGAGTAVGKVKSEYDHKGARLLRFKFLNATRDSVDALEFGDALIGCRLNQRHPFVEAGNRYYVAVGVVRSPSITVSAENERSNNVNLEADALQSAVGAEGKLAVKREQSGEITYEGSTPLAFGVELLEMNYLEDETKFRLAALPEPKKIRGEERIRAEEALKAQPGEREFSRDFIGDAGEGNAFITIAG
jgi:hypothetical protein